MDCEMASVRDGNKVKQGLLVVYVVDFLTGETMLNKLGRPAETIVNYLTWCKLFLENMRSSAKRYPYLGHGITHSKIKIAISRGEALHSWQTARQAVWDLIGTHHET